MADELGFAEAFGEDYNRALAALRNRRAAQAIPDPTITNECDE